MLLNSIIILVVFISTGLCRTTISGLSSVSQTVSLTGVQYSDIEYYDLSASGLSTMQYILFEVEFLSSDMLTIKSSSSVLPFICYMLDVDPSIVYNVDTRSVQPCLNGFSYNQYTRSSGKYSVTVTTPVGTYAKVVLAVFVQGMTVSYTVRARGKFSSSLIDICPFNCGVSASSANCLNKNCVCAEGWLDYDCSVSAQRVKNDIINVNVPIDGSLSYFYFLSETLVSSYQAANSVKIYLVQSNRYPASTVLISAWNQDPSVAVPYTNSFLAYTTTGSSGKQMITMKPSILYDTSFVPQKVVFGLMLKESASSQGYAVTVSMTGSVDESADMGLFNSILIYFIVPVFGILLTTWIIVALIRLKHTRRNRVADLAAITFQQGAAAAQRASRRQQQHQPKNKLTIELIDQYMPALTFAEVQKSAKQRNRMANESCAVCLGDFEDDEICRETICSHSFHRDCLEQWLKKQENCPFCRTDLSRKSLHQHAYGVKKIKDHGKLKIMDSARIAFSSEALQLQPTVTAEVRQLGLVQENIQPEQQQLGMSFSAAPATASRRTRLDQRRYNQSIQVIRQPVIHENLQNPLQNEEHDIEVIQLPLNPQESASNETIPTQVNLPSLTQLQSQSGRQQTAPDQSLGLLINPGLFYANDRQQQSLHMQLQPQPQQIQLY